MRRAIIHGRRAEEPRRVRGDGTAMVATTRAGLLGARLSAIATDDVDEARLHLSRLHRTAVRVGRPDAGSRPVVGDYRYSRIEFADCAVDDVVQRGELSIDFHRLVSTVVVCNVAGRLECTSNGETHSAAPGELLLVGGGAALSMLMEDATLQVTNFETPVFSDAASARQRLGDDAYVRFTGVRPVSPAMARAWTRTSAYVREAILAEPEVATPSMLGAAARLLADTTLAAFPHRLESRAALDEEAALRPELLRRAMAFVERNAHRDIGVADVAAAVFVTPRRVQHLFKQYLDTTPTAYLRLVRLRRVREELVAADRSTTTVTAIAAHWGFAHTGRFAVVYRQAFGESPHQTLRG